MRLRSWLANNCSSNSVIATHNPKVHLSSDSSFASETGGYAASIQSNLSLQTLPSVPSLQKLTNPLDDNSLSIISVTSLINTQNPNSNNPINCLTTYKNLLYVASAYEVNVFDLKTHSHINTFNGNDPTSGSVKSVHFCNGKVFTSHQDCKIRVWKLTSNKKHKLLTLLPTVNDRLRRFILPQNYVNVRRHKKQLWIEHADAVTGIAVNNGLVYSVSWDKSLKVWRGNDFRCLETVNAHNDAINAVTVSLDGTVYTGSADHRIRVWVKRGNEKRHTLLATLEKHKSAVNALALNDDGSVLFSGACDRSILVWEREDSANHMVVTGALRGHGKAILSLIYGCDLLMSGSSDRTVRIWQRGFDGKFCCLAVLEGHNRPVKSLVVLEGDEDGVVSVISGSLDGEIKVWQLSVLTSCSPESGLSRKLNC